MVCVCSSRLAQASYKATRGRMCPVLTTETVWPAKLRGLRGLQGLAAGPGMCRVAGVMFSVAGGAQAPQRPRERLAFLCLCP